MKKMNYQAPKAEMIEMQMPVVLAETIPGSTGGDPSDVPGPSTDPDPWS